MVTVETIQDYRDLEKSMIFHKGERHDVTKQRADNLVDAGVVKIVKPKDNKTPKASAEKIENED